LRFPLHPSALGVSLENLATAVPSRELAARTFFASTRRRICLSSFVIDPLLSRAVRLVTILQQGMPR